MRRLIIGITLFSLFITLTGCKTSPSIDPIIEVEVTKSNQVYLKDSEDEFTIYKFETNVKGPTFFIIGGIHGNERAGWTAALKMLDYSFTRGTVYVLPVASKRAVEANPPVRFVSGGTNVNREFPGNKDGAWTQKLAYTIFEAMVSCEPDIVLDLHESRMSYTDGNLGDTVILNLGRYSLFLDALLYDLNALELMDGKTPFTYYNAPPVGSINKEFSERLNVPVFTVETNRNTSNNRIDTEKIALAERVNQQLAVVKLFLDTFGLE